MPKIDLFNEEPQVVMFDFPNLYNLNREDPYMYRAYSKELQDRGYMCLPANEGMYSDVVISYKPRRISTEQYKKWWNNDATMIYIYPDARPEPPAEVLEVAQHFDYFLTVCGIDMWKEALPDIKVIQFPQAVEPQLYHVPGQFSPDKARRNWSFIGSYYEGRKGLYRALETQKSNGKIWGNGWQACPYNVPWTKEEVYNRQYAHVLRRGLVSVNWSYMKNNKYAWSTRVFKTMASGVPLLTDKVEGLDEYFVEGKHYFAYENRKQLSSMIADPIGAFGKEELEMVAHFGKEQVNSAHTYEIRAIELANVCGL